MRPDIAPSPGISSWGARLPGGGGDQLATRIMHLSLQAVRRSKSGRRTAGRAPLVLSLNPQGLIEDLRVVDADGAWRALRHRDERFARLSRVQSPASGLESGQACRAVALAAWFRILRCST